MTSRALGVFAAAVTLALLIVLTSVPPPIDVNAGIAKALAYGGAIMPQRVGNEASVLPHEPDPQNQPAHIAPPVITAPPKETVLVEGEGAQNAMRWEDYTQTAVDPSDDCTIWYVGDYMKKGATNYSSRIGAFRMPGCRSEN